jgi:hypothetical protein
MSRRVVRAAASRPEGISLDHRPDILGRTLTARVLERRLAAAPEPRRQIVVVADARLVRSRLSGALGRDAPTGKRLLDAFGLVADCSPRRPATVEGIGPSHRMVSRRVSGIAGSGVRLAWPTSSLRTVDLRHGRAAGRTITFG